MYILWHYNNFYSLKAWHLSPALQYLISSCLPCQFSLTSFDIFTSHTPLTSSTVNFKCISCQLRIATHVRELTPPPPLTPAYCLLYCLALLFYLHCIYHLSCKYTEAFTCPSTIACCKWICQTNKYMHVRKYVRVCVCACARACDCYLMASSNDNLISIFYLFFYYFIIFLLLSFCCCLFSISHFYLRRLHGTRAGVHKKAFRK